MSQIDFEKRAKEALEIALKYGTDGDIHNTWTIDQMVRALTGCPVVQETGIYNGTEFTYDCLGENEEYKQVIKEYCDGEDGPNTYVWNTGIAP